MEHRLLILLLLSRSPKSAVDLIIQSSPWHAPLQSTLLLKEKWFKLSKFKPHGRVGGRGRSFVPGAVFLPFSLEEATAPGEREGEQNQVEMPLERSLVLV